jgi:hypothetical protein
MRNGYDEMCKYLTIMRRPFVICDFATDPIRISLFKRIIFFSFLSVYKYLSLPVFEDSVCYGGRAEAGRSIHLKRY